MGWLGDYVEYGAALTDAPGEFAEMLGLALLGQAVGRNSTHPLKPFPIRHNIFVILLGEPGRARKSTSLDIARTVSSTHVFPEQFSPEALVDELKDQSVGLLFIDEVSSLLKKAFDRRSYMSGTLELLSRAYDCPDMLDRRTKSGGLVQARNIYVSLVAATTSESFKSSIEPEALDGGFLTRCLIVEPRKRKIKARGYLDSEVTQSGEDIAESLKSLSQAGGLTFKFEGDAFEKYHRYCSSLERRYRKLVSGGFISRYEDYMVKIADLYEVSDAMDRSGSQSSPSSQGSQSSIIHVTTRSLSRAYDLVDSRLKGILRICEFCESAKPVLKVKAVLERHGPCERSKILRYGHMMSDELDRALRTLTESKEVISENGSYRLAKRRR